MGIRQGQLDIHGRPRRVTWTRLASTALANDTTLELQETVDWVPGDRIVIAPTSKDGNETEVSINIMELGRSKSIELTLQENEVASVSPSGRTVSLVQPLMFTHHGLTETFEDEQFIELR